MSKSRSKVPFTADPSHLTEAKLRTICEFMRLHIETRLKNELVLLEATAERNNTVVACMDALKSSGFDRAGQAIPQMPHADLLRTLREFQAADALFDAVQAKFVEVANQVDQANTANYGETAYRISTSLRSRDKMN